MNDTGWSRSLSIANAVSPARPGTSVQRLQRASAASARRCARAEWRLNAAAHSAIVTTVSEIANDVLPIVPVTASAVAVSAATVYPSPKQSAIAVSTPEQARPKRRERRAGAGDEDDRRDGEEAGDAHAIYTTAARAFGGHRHRAVTAARTAVP